MRWTVPANNSIIIAEHISFADIEQYAVWCVYDKYYPWLSQTRIDNVIDAVADKADNFVNARQCIDSAMASYPFAFAIENVRELSRGLVAAEKDFSSNVKIELTPLNFEGKAFVWEKSVELRHGANKFDYQLDVPGAAQWYPNNYGKSNL